MKNSRTHTPKFASSFAAQPDGGGEEEPFGGEDTEADDAGKDAGKDEDDSGDEDQSWDSQRALAKIRKANAEAKSQRERAKAAEEKAAGADGLEKRASAAEAKVLRLEVALDLGLPKTLAGRLQGNTVEELTADAEELLALFHQEVKHPASDRPKPRLRGGTTPSEEDDEMDAKTVVDKALGV